MNEDDTDRSNRDAEARQLLRAAFRAARAKGRPDWTRMTTAVLKNRLLQLSNRQFDERLFGAETFTDFLAKYSDVVRLDTSSTPAVAQFVELEGDVGSPSAAVSRDRIRRDLWNAVVDYRSGQIYVWDAEHNRAVVDDSGLVDLGLRLPTLSKTELAEWRRVFAEQQLPELSAQAASTLTLWADRGLGTGRLPPQLRGEWNQYQREMVLHRLREWFVGKELEVPVDIVQQLDTKQREPADTTLRDFIRRCIDVMTHDELAQLSLPADVVIRAQGK